MSRKALLLLALICLSLALYFHFSQQALGQEQDKGMTSYYTKAFCSQKLCEDLEVYCRAGKVVKIVPTGFMIENSRGLLNAEEELCGG